MMPPKPSEISPSDLWAQITQMPRPHRIVDFPRKGLDGQPLGQVALRVLTQEEAQLATAFTEQRVRRLLKEKEAMPGSGEPSQGYSILFDTWASCETLFRCTRKVDDINQPFFPAVEMIPRSLSQDEIAILLLEYNRVRAELGPIVADMSQEEYDAWIEVLAKGGSAYPLDSLSLGEQSRLIVRMASELYTLRTASSSPGSQPAKST